MLLLQTEIFPWSQVNEEYPIKMDLMSLAVYDYVVSTPAIPTLAPTISPPPTPGENGPLMQYNRAGVSGTDWVSSNGQFALACSGSTCPVVNTYFGQSFVTFTGHDGEFYTKKYSLTDDLSWLPKQRFSIQAKVRLRDAYTSWTAIFGYMQDNGATQKARGTPPPRNAGPNFSRENSPLSSGT